MVSVGRARGAVVKRMSRATLWQLFLPPLILVLLASVLIHPRPLWVWNLTSSAPLGLFKVVPTGALRRNDLVVASLDGDWQRYAVERHYLADHVLLVKYIAALAGDRLCARGRALQINGRTAAIRRWRDGAGRPLPNWQGCRRLQSSEVLLLNAKRPDSFDGRYFGPTPRADILGRAVRP